jgi:hypothetical protein
MSRLGIQGDGAFGIPGAHRVDRAGLYHWWWTSRRRLGGSDVGANPVEYVLAALAGCLNVVGHSWRAELGFPSGPGDRGVSGTLNPGAPPEPAHGRPGGLQADCCDPARGFRRG